MSKIEQIITEIEEYVASCSNLPLSNTKIIVNRDEMEEYLAELKLKTPEEIKKYKKIISNREAILTEGKERAEFMITQATAQTSELVSEHEIMQQAYIQANEVVQQATVQAKQILDSATMEANEVKASAMQYVDDILSNVQNAVTFSMQDITNKYENYMKSLNSSLEVVIANRKELNPSDEINEELLPDAPSENTEEEDLDFQDYTVDLDSFDE